MAKKRRRFINQTHKIFSKVYQRGEFGRFERRLENAAKRARTQQQRERAQRMLEQFREWRDQLERSPAAGMMNLIDEITSRDTNSELKIGFVIDAYPFARLYRVISGAGVHVCKLLMRGSASLFGAADADTMMPGTLVWFLLPRGATHGIILGTDPFYGTGYNSLNDVIFQGSGVGLKFDPTFHIPFLKQSFGIADFSNRTPEDSLEGGEFCRITESGSMIFLDPYMSIHRISEVCGIWMFLYDMLMRIIGHNMQIWTSISQEEYYAHYGESIYYRGLALFPHEQFGYLGHDAIGTAFRENNPKIALKEKGRTRIEPEWPYAPSVHRYKEFYGYFFGGYRRMIVMPQAQVLNTQLGYGGRPLGNTIDIQRPFTNYRLGLINEILSHDGRYGLQAMNGIFLMKTPFIDAIDRGNPVNQRADEDFLKRTLRRKHFIPRKDIRIVGINAPLTVGQRAELKTAAQLLILARLFKQTCVNGIYELYPGVCRTFNQSGLHNNSEFIVQSSQGDDISFRSYANSAFICINDDGSIVLGDGFGGSIRMANGRIYLDAETIVLNARNLVMPCNDEVYLSHPLCLSVKYIDDESLRALGVREYTVPVEAGNPATNDEFTDVRFSVYRT
jgi:hypothetical protein